MSEAEEVRRRTGVDPQDTEYFDDVVEPGVDEQLPTPVRNLLSKDFPLSNISSNDREYIRLLADNVVLYSREMFPPEESLVQGDVGAALLEDPDYDRAALPEHKQNEIESIMIASFARTSRGQSGWQQDKLNEGIQTQRIEDERDDGDDGGRFGGIF